MVKGRSRGARRSSCETAGISSRLCHDDRRAHYDHYVLGPLMDVGQTSRVPGGSRQCLWRCSA